MTVADTLSSYFDIEEHDTTLRTEVLAGITTFLTMSYIVVVNPAIMTGIPSAKKPGIVLASYSPGQVQQMLAVVTIISAAIATLVMAFYAKRPFAQAPGLGLNAFFAFTVVGALKIHWQTALAAVVTEGIIFILLTAVGARRYIIELFPEPVKLAVGTGIGLFLTIIGLEQMHIVASDPATLVTLGGVASDPVAIVAVLGLLLTFALYAADVRGSIIIGILSTTVIGWVVTAVGLVPANAGLTATWQAPMYNISPLAGAFLSGFGNVDGFAFALIVFTFFFVDFFDTAGTLT
ncbi:MAG: solute carrier family 23 protein, partial [Salinigranum sp.]